MDIKKIATLIFCLSSFFVTQVESAPTIEVPEIVLTSVPFEVSVTDFEQQQVCEYQLQINDFIFEPTVCNGNELIFEYLLAEEKSDNQLELLLDQKKIASEEINVLSGWLSILPPLVSILVALLFRSVIPALFLGVWIGSFAILGLKVGVLWQSFLEVVSKYVKQALADPDHAAVIIFSLMIGGLVGIISKNGGMQGIVNSLTGFTTSSKRGQLITSSLGLAIFFDDYANTLVVGNTMRKVTDKLKISRAKLAFLVDATAAPVACIALITTWVGYQIGMIDGINLSH